MFSRDSEAVSLKLKKLLLVLIVVSKSGINDSIDVAITVIRTRSVNIMPYL